ncbi:MAG TPA: Holliday junction branch migration protein RuvA [Verrucomicrobiaceae bacterium]|jgi:Holliday junction DNA helicase RuvA
MISHLRGQLVEALPNQLVVEVHGVGYKCLVPLSTYDKLAGGSGEVKLLTHLHITDRDHTLFGFATGEERDLFKLLMDRVSGVGPKLALAVLSGTSVSDFKDHVIRGDVTALSRISGVGKKTAERIVLELKDKVGIVDTWQAAKGGTAKDDPSAAAQTDAVLALIALGYKQSEAHQAVQKTARQTTGEITADKLIREALRELR